MSSLIPLLQFCLPATGNLTCFVLPTRKHFWTQSISELAAIIRREDAAGHDVYFALASYENHRRKGSEARFLKALWLDVDAGEGKPYTDAGQAWVAVEAWRQKTGWPEPIYVGSGGGLHVYWVLEREVTPAEWKPMADNLHTLCLQHGLHVDTSRTRDLASILRPPETHNRKYKDVVVTAGELTGPWPLKLFQAKKSLGVNKILKATDVIDRPPSNGAVVANKCAQLGALRDTRGRISEPEWYACLGVLAWCEGGDALAHEWSQGDERYSEDETQRKLDRARVLTGPITCAQFSNLNSKCKTCAFLGKITTPVDLGRAAPEPKLSEAVSISKVDPEKRDLPEIDGFVYGAKGQLLFATESRSGTPVNTLVTQYPVYIESLSRNEKARDSFSATFAFKPPHEVWQSSTVPIKMLFGQSGLAEIMGRGIIIHDWDLFKKYMRLSMDKLNGNHRAGTCYEQFGWKGDDSFLVGTRLYSSLGVTTVNGSSDVEARARLMGPIQGSLAGWQEAANQLFQVGLEAQAFALLASFAAPLMKFQSHDEGGAIVSIISRGPGQGKTTALAAAASVWGRMTAMKMSTTDTRVAQGLTLGVMGNLPVIIDEFSARDPDVVKEQIQIFTNGRDKARGTQQGGLAPQVSEWQTILITGSNISLTDTLNAATGGIAMATRVMEFAVTLPKDVKHWAGDKLKGQLDANAGHAGHAFAKALTAPGVVDFVRTSLENYRTDLIQKTNMTSDQRFWARTLSGVAVAAIIVRDLGLVQFSPDRIVDWAINELRTGAMALSQIESHFDPVGLLSRYLAEHWLNTLVVENRFTSRFVHSPILMLPRGRLLIRHEVKPGKVAIEESHFRTWCVAQGEPYREIIKSLCTSQVILTNRRNTSLGAGTDIPSGQTPCVIVDALHPQMTGALNEVHRRADEAAKIGPQSLVASGN